MKTIRNMIINGFIAGLLLLAGSCTKETNELAANPFSDLLKVADDGTTLLVNSNLGACLTEDFTFSDDELDILLHMKEEEKLAGDVYTFLYEKWGTPVFLNISKAEQTHQKAVLYLLDSYGDDYTISGEAGVFENPDFQELYGQLIQKGSESLEAAMETGALIEEMDIKDLEEALAVVENENIKIVFENLLRGSRNHLRAFNRQLDRLGVKYTPVYISQEDYDQIVSTPNETGSGNQKNNQFRKGR
ncbi:MAG: DUF2202 domain-containing protein, partial [Bacteroidales bacterium]|nr:DUF2202 domain-containing protein [Bacteroidales bacterium]